MKINDFLSGYKENFLALSIFLLITFTLAFNKGEFNRPLGVLAAGISYFLMLEVIFKDKGDENPLISLFNMFLIFFTILFCFWVIINLIFPPTNIGDYLIALLWMGFIYIVPFKVVNKGWQIAITIGVILVVLLALISLLFIIS